MNKKIPKFHSTQIFPFTPWGLKGKERTFGDRIPTFLSFLNHFPFPIFWGPHPWIFPSQLGFIHPKNPIFHPLEIPKFQAGIFSFRRDLRTKPGIPEPGLNSPKIQAGIFSSPCAAHEEFGDQTWNC